jgi:hypothetical protein
MDSNNDENFHDKAQDSNWQLFLSTDSDDDDDSKMFSLNILVDFRLMNEQEHSLNKWRINFSR